MKILFYVTNYYPELTGSGKYTGELARWLSQEGYSVRVVAAPPYYPAWKIGDGYKGWAYHIEKDSIRVFRCPIWIPRAPSGRNRIVHLLSFALSSFPIVLWQIFWRPTVVVVIEPPIICAPAGWLVARLSGARCWLHIQDFEVDAAFDLGLVKGRGIRRAISAMERWLMGRFDRVSTISKKMLNYLEAKGVPEGVLLPNWVDTEEIRPLNAPSSYREELGIAKDAIVALYSGNMGKKQGLEVLAEVARQCAILADAEIDESGRKIPTIFFIFSGAGAGRADLEQVCAGLTNVRFLELQPAKRLNEWLNLADIHLLPQRADAADLVMPSKLTGMMASGRPTVATAQEGTEIAGVLKDSGFVVPPGDVKAFCEKLTLLASERGLREKMGQAARQYAEEFLAKENVLSRFEEELKACVAGR
jgi:colanic acid biosynthesis glycosyl transferase WcaI